jgi:hypothetical protein
MMTGSRSVSVASPIPVDAAVTPDRAAVLQYLRRLWPEGPRHLYLYVWRPGAGSRYFGGAATEAASLTLLDEAADYIVTQPVNCYVGMCLADADHGPSHRLSRKEGRLAFTAPGCWIDIDFSGPGHKSANLPRSCAEVESILHAAGLAPYMPTFAVHTGGGLHLYWLFREPWFFQPGSDPKFHERDRFASILRRLQRLIRDAATARGLAVDATHDLERVLRPPGTIRVKDGCAPVQTRFAEEFESGASYNHSDFEELLDSLGVTDREEKTGTSTVVGGVTVNPHAIVDANQLQLMIDADPTLSQILNLQKPTGKRAAPEDSFSERDLQLANYLADKAGFDEQHIVDWLIWFRREKAAPGHKRPKHVWNGPQN